MSASATLNATPVTTLATQIDDLRGFAQRTLVRMFLPGQGVYGFKLQRRNGEILLEGVSRRYTAIVLIGLVSEDPGDAARMLHGRDPQDVCAALVASVADASDLGEAALALWAARAWGHESAGPALAKLRSLEPERRPWPTVELAWCVTALSIDGGETGGDAAYRDALCRRLRNTQDDRSALFSHYADKQAPSRLRGHVTCFADFVYPIQALSYYHRATGDRAALSAAQRCAEQMVRLQGPAGQWWWHFDYRTGRVVEGFPVYAVHQHSMAPMALRALHAAGGPEHLDAIRKSIAWLYSAPELRDGGLVDRPNDVIWRKVARHEPNKLVRGIQAAASGVHPALRAPAMNLLFRPGWIDAEMRPYESGWILHCWPPGRS